MYKTKHDSLFSQRTQEQQQKKGVYNTVGTLSQGRGGGAFSERDRLNSRQSRGTVHLPKHLLSPFLVKYLAKTRPVAMSDAITVLVRR